MMIARRQKDEVKALRVTRKLISARHDVDLPRFNDFGKIWMSLYEDDVPDDSRWTRECGGRAWDSISVFRKSLKRDHILDLVLPSRPAKNLAGVSRELERPDLGWVEALPHRYRTKAQTAVGAHWTREPDTVSAARSCRSNSMSICGAVLNYHAYGRNKHANPPKGQWNMINKKSMGGPTLYSWACLNLSSHVDHRIQSELIMRLLSICNPEGMEFNSNTENPPYPSAPILV